MRVQSLMLITTSRNLALSTLLSSTQIRKDSRDRLMALCNEGRNKDMCTKASMFPSA